MKVPLGSRPKRHDGSFHRVTPLTPVAAQGQPEDPRAHMSVQHVPLSKTQSPGPKGTADVGI